MIYDCFMFFNELELLEIRINELDDIVDKFVIVEATRTHANKPKPLYYKENAKMFGKFDKKIIHIIVKEDPNFKDPMAYENHQRNQISQIFDGCHQDDVFIISDVDEIPRPKAVIEAIKTTGIKTLVQTLYYYFFNNIYISNPYWLGGTRVLRKKEFTKTASEIRYMDCDLIKWHFSWLGGPERIQTKIESMGHQKYNQAQFKDIDHLKKVIKKGRDLFKKRKKKIKTVPLDSTFPKYILENQERFKEFIQEPEQKKSSWKLSKIFSG